MKNNGIKKSIITFFLILSFFVIHADEKSALPHLDETSFQLAMSFKKDESEKQDIDKTIFKDSIAGEIIKNEVAQAKFKWQYICS